MYNLKNTILKTDSYKYSHHKQYPNKSEYLSAYIESRGGKWDRTVFFGLQMFLKGMAPITVADVEEAKLIVDSHMGPGIFDYDGWMDIAVRLNGKLPLLITAVPEGTIIPGHNVLVQITNTEPGFAWLVSFMETAILRAVWFPTTVATNSWTCKQAIMKSLQLTSDDPEGQIAFKLHDFSARGVSSSESAGIGGAAHLVNFMGSDTVEGLLYAMNFYGGEMPGFSIPASEHSTISSYGRNGEFDAFKNMLNQFAKPGALLACVSDTYDLWNAIDYIWGERLKTEIVESGALLVVRPDSGDPNTVPTEVITKLDAKFGSVVNKKGYKVLNHVRCIQGDGITAESIPVILKNLNDAGYSTDNLALGMGGGLTQMVNRDTLRFAQKASAICIEGEWRDIFKNPITDPGKTSKKGRLALIRKNDKYETVKIEDMNGAADILQPVWKNGELLVDHTFAEVRARSNQV
jgi:nicotinamide phosphoribosyltransferase